MTGTTPTQHLQGQTLSIYVVIFPRDTPYKHWSLFVDGPSADMKVQHQIVGPNWNGYFEYKKADDLREGRYPFDLIFLCKVSVVHFDRINFIAENMPVCKYRREWDKQAYVLHLIEQLENDGLIDVPPMQEDGYGRRVEYIRGRQEQGNVSALRGLWDCSLWSDDGSQ
ncbi:hypothetical protein PHISCL_06131 [Aspergillus sclerotialis]|uniref:Uncharacterized protein n=1 Tax=Aspergillus sclerotialis TaxID=2070753 RepID=A0A3A2ZJF5_9EURO|nr:hypothetical protein PHISCL_06131 [Aspergillus sclerotialis]